MHAGGMVDLTYLCPACSPTLSLHPLGYPATRALLQIRHRPQISLCFQHLPPISPLLVSVRSLPDCPGCPRLCLHPRRSLSPSWKGVLQPLLRFLRPDLTTPHPIHLTEQVHCNSDSLTVSALSLSFHVSLKETTGSQLGCEDTLKFVEIPSNPIGQAKKYLNAQCLNAHQCLQRQRQAFPILVHLLHWAKRLSKS